MNASSSSTPLYRASRSFGLAGLLLTLLGCSTPHGYGVDERALRTPDGSSGVVAGEASAPQAAATTEMQSRSTYLNLITQMQHEGQYFASLAHLDTYEARFGPTAESTLLRGDAQRLTDQPALATLSYTALKSTPLASAGYRGLSLLAGARGDFKGAATLLEQAVTLNSTDAVSLSDLGYTRIRLGDLPGARIPLMTAAQLAPANSKVMSNLALYLVLAGDAKQAEAVMNGAAMTPSVKHAIYLQAGQLGHGGVTDSTSPQSRRMEGTPHPGATAKSVSNYPEESPLRIDFSMASPPQAAGSTAAVVATNQP